MTAPSFSHIVLLGTVLALAGCGKPNAVQHGPPHPLPASPLVAPGEPRPPGGRPGVAAPHRPPTRSGPAPPPPLPASPLVAQGDPGQPGGRLVIAASASPRTFNPLFSVDGSSDGIIRLLFASLVNMDWATDRKSTR